MTINIKNVLEPSIRDLIINASGLSGDNVIFYHPNAPRPTFPYATINYLATSKNINDWQTMNTDTGLLELFGIREMTYSVKFYGEGAFDLANKVQSHIFLNANRQALYNGSGTSILRAKSVMNDYQLVNSRFEERSVLDIVFNVAFENGEVTEDVGYFDQVEVIWENKP